MKLSLTFQADDRTQLEADIASFLPPPPPAGLTLRALMLVVHEGAPFGPAAAEVTGGGGPITVGLSPSGRQDLPGGLAVDGTGVYGTPDAGTVGEWPGYILRAEDPATGLGVEAPLTIYVVEQGFAQR